MRVASALLSAALAVTLLTPVAAQASDPPPESSTSTVLPPYWTTRLPARQLVTVSDQYAMHRRVWNQNGGYAGFPIVRLSDGAVVSSYHSSDFPGANFNLMRLDGDALLVQYPAGTTDNGRVDVVDPETFKVRGELVVPSDESHLAAGADWLLTLWRNPSGTLIARLHFLDRPTIDVTIPDSAITGSSRLVGRIGDVVYLAQNSTLAALDLVTGAVTRLVGPNATEIYPYGFWNGPFVDGDRAVQLETDWTARTVSANWYDAETWTEHQTALGSMDGGGYYPFGDDLLRTTGPSDGPYTLSRVDLDTGTSTSLPGQLIDAKPDGAGGLVVTQDDDPDDYLGVIADDGTGVRRVATLSRVPYYMEDVHLDRGSVSAVAGINEQIAVGTTADGTSPWTEQAHAFTTAGDARLERIPDPTTYSSSHWQLSWPGGSRTIDAYRVRLGHGGELAIIGNGTVQRVRPASDGSVDVSSPVPGTTAAADGSWVWFAPGADHLVHGFDADDPRRTREVDAGVSCASSTVDVRGDFMLLACSTKGYSYVVDLTGKLPTWRVPVSSTQPSMPRLGDGFLVYNYFNAWTPERDAFTGLRVADLTAQHRITSIRDVATDGRYVADDADSHRIAYVNSSGLATVRDLTRPDATAPVPGPGGLDTPAAVASTVPVAAAYGQTWGDASYGIESSSGTATVDVRTRTRTVGSDWSDWTTAPQDGDTASATVDVEPGHGVCFSSRGVDRAGNTSDWSAPRCTTVDGAGPTNGRLSHPGRFALPDDNGRISFGYGATDDFGIASYDVQTRRAKPGHLLGGWVDRRTATTATRLSVPAPAGSEWCARFRARDLAGNVSSWSGARCTSVILDDRALAAWGPTARKTSSLALAHTVTVLRRKGAGAEGPGTQRGRTLAVWVLRGPGQGTMVVRVGDRRLARLATAAPTWRRTRVLLPMKRSGPVRFSAAGGGPVRVDAFTVER